MPMYSKRRQSSSNSDELSSRYEFVDYTSVSPFEKFITHIEETLYSWGIKDGSFGIFSQQQLDNAKAAIAHPSAVEFTRKETLAMGDDVYQLTYHYHPTFTTEATTQPLAADHFYQYTSQYHPLHRWTGQDRIMVIQPMQGSLKTKIFNTTGKSSADMALAKHLISACAIAFHNTECQVPIFVPVGQSRHDMYVGLMVRGSHEGSALKDTETRFTMTLTTPPTSEFSDLDGLQALFLQKLNVHRQDYGKKKNAQ
jgi:Rab3 GTPase-activating protein catalytic subunit